MDTPSHESYPQTPISEKRHEPDASTDDNPIPKPEPQFLSHFPTIFPALLFVLAIFNSILWSFAIVLAYRNHTSPIYTMLQIALPNKNQTTQSLAHQIFPQLVLPTPTPMPSPTPTPFIPQLITKINLLPTPLRPDERDFAGQAPTSTTQPTPTPTTFFVSNNDIIEGNTYTMPKGACTKPLTYRIDAFDDRFGISRDDFTRDIQRSADIWNKTVNKTLFQSDPNGTIRINLVYDDRQLLMNKLSSLQQQLMTESTKITSEKSEFEAKKSTYEQTIAVYNQANTSSYTGPLTLADLQKMYDDLTRLKTDLETLVSTINTDVASYNANVSTYNTTKTSLNEMMTKTPYAGLYNVNENIIYVFIYRSTDNLVHTIAHELGHAIGLGHNSDTESIMYADTSSTTHLSTQDTAAIVTRCSL